MSITVQIPTALRRHTAGVGSLNCAAGNLAELFSVLDEKFPALKPHLRDEAGQVRRFLNVYVNEEDIRFLGGPSYAFHDGDEVLLVPSIAGGSPDENARVHRRPWTYLFRDTMLKLIASENLEYKELTETA